MPMKRANPPPRRRPRDTYLGDQMRKSSIRRLSDDDQLAILRRARTDTGARNQMVMNFLPMAFNAYNKGPSRWRRLDLGEAVNECAARLSQAFLTYDPDRDNPAVSMARTTVFVRNVIRSALTHLAARDRLIPLNESWVSYVLKRDNQAADGVASRRTATRQKLLTAMAAVKSLSLQTSQPLSGELRGTEDNPAFLKMALNAWEDHHPKGPEPPLSPAQLPGAFTTTEWALVRARFGIGRDGPLTWSQLEREFGSSRETLRNRLRHALERVRSQTGFSA